MKKVQKRAKNGSFFDVLLLETPQKSAIWGGSKTKTSKKVTFLTFLRISNQN